MEYTNYEKNSTEPVDGFILQAPVSDREIMPAVTPNWEDCLEEAKRMIADGKADWCMPQDKNITILGAPMSAYRLWSLLEKK